MGCNSTTEKAAVKEFVKTLGALSPHTWITKQSVRTYILCKSIIDNWYYSPSFVWGQGIFFKLDSLYEKSAMHRDLMLFVYVSLI